ncbi:MAG: MBL fold metallo-hydrolase [Pygmaiobacter massiliensis]|nr:MBL fold metallo-hydrolase [Pygmaiobacter massiliensis]
MASFTALYSGSSGNAALIQEKAGSLCVDMGKNCKTTLAALSQAGVEPGSLQGILVTHEHVDHVSGLRVFLKRYPVPVYASGKTLESLLYRQLVPPGAKLCVLEEQKTAIGPFAVTAFPTSHDAADCHGFRIQAESGGTLALATDLGCVTEPVYQNLRGADLVVLEANYDAAMLQQGPYPAYLKARIASSRGHLCNTDTAAALAKLLQEGCQRFALCHLSSENNTPERALQTVTRAFLEKGALPGKDGLLVALRRHCVSPTLAF